MDLDRWRHIEELYNSAVERSPADREALLAQADPDIRREVEVLLAQPSGSALLDQSAADLLSETTLTQLPSGTWLGQYQIESLLGRGGSSSSASSEDGRFPPGTLLGKRYRIVAIIGRGGMGEVYRASDLKLNQPVALKFLPEAVAAKPGLMQRFHGEVRIARQVSHPNVCRVYDIGEAEGSTFISMEYVDGEDLGSLLRRIGRLPRDKGVEIARKLCAGLAAAHAKGVLHRDRSAFLQARQRAPLLPPPSARMKSSRAVGYRWHPSINHH